MRSFDKGILDEIRRRVRLSELIGEEIALKARGREFVGLSPFTQEKTASFTVNDDKGFWHCFSSGRHGDCFEWIKVQRGVSFVVAVRMLAEVSGVVLEGDEAERLADRDGLYKIMEVSANYWHTRLLSDAGMTARSYLKGRGIGDDEISRFRLGLCELDLSGLMTEVRNWTPLASRLLKLFRGRIVFPITDAGGRVVSFGGRMIGEGTGPKYLNGRDSVIFRKREHFYGRATATPEAQKKGRVIIVEGYIDAVRMQMSGFGETVGACGSTVDFEGLSRAFPYVERKLILLDGDDAGTAGRDRLIDAALQAAAPSRAISFASLPDGDDPASLLDHAGTDELTRVLDRSIDLVEALWERSVRRCPALGLERRTPEAIGGLLVELEQAVSLIAEPRLREWYETYLVGRVEVLFGPKRSLSELHASGRFLGNG